MCILERSFKLFLWIAETSIQTVEWTRLSIFDIVKTNLNGNLSDQIDSIVRSLINAEADSSSILPDSREALKKVFCKLKSKWKDANYIQERFLSKNKKCGGKR